MTKKERNTVLQQAIQKYGVQDQLNSLKEESAAMIEAVKQYESIRECAQADLICMMASLEVRLMQLRLLFNDAVMNELINHKIRVLRKRLQGNEENTPRGNKNE